mgnify:CR=1 FL=1
MFKRLGELPVGALVKDPETTYYGKPIVWKIADKNHSGYPANSVTLITDKLIGAKTFDGKELKNSDSSRRDYGNNYYKYSNILQWLNSDAKDWYKPMHNADAPPSSGNIGSGSPYDKEAGFLTNFSAGFKREAMPTSLKTVRPSLDGGGSESVESKFFLASTTEVGLANENGIAEGSKLAVFTDDSSRKAILTDEAVKNSSYSDSGFKGGNYWRWWLRTPYTSYSYYVRFVLSDGTLDWYNAYYGSRGLRPLCNLKSGILVSENKDSDGAYVITWNRVPIIESTNKDNMGQQDKEFSFDYKVIEEDEGQTLRVEEYINDTKIKDFSAKSGSTYTYNLERLTYQKLPNGNHKVKIVAIDSEGGVTEKVFNFSKNETKILFELEKPLEADGMVTKALITMVGSIPEKAILKVEACNNGHDKNPTWEDVTTKVIKERKIFFANKQKTAEKWGVNIRVSVDRNGEKGQCQILSIGGNFE